MFLIGCVAFLSFVLWLENRISFQEEKAAVNNFDKIAKVCLRGTDQRTEAVGTCPASILGSSANFDCSLLALWIVTAFYIYQFGELYISGVLKITTSNP